MVRVDHIIIENIMAYDINQINLIYKTGVKA
jgi:hypothetical protein